MLMDPPDIISGNPSKEDLILKEIVETKKLIFKMKPYLARESHRISGTIRGKDVVFLFMSIVVAFT